MSTETKLSLNQYETMMSEAADELTRVNNINSELLTALRRIELRSHDAVHSVTEARQWVRQFRSIANAAIAKATK